MKKIQLTGLFLITSIFVSVNLFGQNRWWQREIPTPSANQIINPDYLAKKRELEKTIDELNSLARRRNNYARAGQTQAVKSADEMLQFIGKKMNKMEYELSKIPMYITKPTNPQNIIIQSPNRENDNIHNTQPSSVNSDNSFSDSKGEFDETIFEGKYKFRTTLIDNPVIDVKLRKDSSVNAHSRYIITQQDIIYVIDRSNKTYFKVYTNGYIGYVRSAYLKRQE